MGAMYLNQLGFIKQHEQLQGAPQKGQIGEILRKVVSNVDGRFPGSLLRVRHEKHVYPAAPKKRNLTQRISLTKVVRYIVIGFFTILNVVTGVPSGSTDSQPQKNKSEIIEKSGGVSLTW